VKTTEKDHQQGPQNNSVTKEEMMDDHEVIRRVLSGNVNDYRILVEKYQNLVFNLFMKMLQNKSEAFEQTQVLFVKTYTMLPSFRFENKFFSWIYRIAINQALNQIRIRRRFSGNNLPESFSPPNSEPDQDIRKEVSGALNLLKDQHKIVIVLKYYRQLSYNEMAFVLGVSEQKVKSRLFEARLELKKILKSHGF
jgi:RNA polymerase sigma-70 factor, ECF subfamily